MEPMPPPDQAARLAALRARTVPSDRLPQPDQAARLAALSARVAGPPPFPSHPTTPPPAPRGRPRRRHAARGARATALGLSLASTGALATLFAFTQGGASGSGTQVAAASVVVGTTATSTVPATTTATTTRTATTPATSVESTVVAGDTAVVDGAVFHNKWGDVQVEVTFAADGSIADATTLKTPYVDDKSVRINQRAAPRLNSEALTAQSADVDTVSGATYTSNDYRRSLQSAIDAANAAGITTIA